MHKAGIAGRKYHSKTARPRTENIHRLEAKFQTNMINPSKSALPSPVFFNLLNEANPSGIQTNESHTNG